VYTERKRVRKAFKNPSWQRKRDKSDLYLKPV